ncbi:MAG TPA: VCBS repeat-containing protein [Nannocystaceae bacterium]|nr:VCBS repeat-containing protein [Nannocystaceae bacterium]
MTRATWIGLTLLACSGSSVAHAGSNMWVELADAFGTQPCSGSGCYTNYMRMHDLDGDGDLDIVYPNDGGAAQPLVIYANDGNAGFTDVSDDAVGGHMGRIRQVAIGDVDGDGDVDMYAPEGTVSAGALFINDGSGAFMDEGDARLPAAEIAVGATRFGDLDDDGDLDIVVCDRVVSGDCLVYQNDGDGNFTELLAAIPFNVGQDINDIDLLDVDRDFDLDLLTNAHAGADRIWINDGTGVFQDSDFNSSSGLHYGPGVCDIEGDGDLDIWIDNQGPNYTERLWANDGTGTFTDVTVAQVNGNPNSDDNGIICADFDSDGDFDAVVVALSTPERLLVNDGTGNFDYQAGAFSGPTDSSLGAEMGDLDGDHRIDIATAQGESGSFLNRVFLATDLVPEDDTAPTIIVIGDPPADELQAGEVGIIHWAVSDDALSDHGPRLASAYALLDPAGVAQQVPAFFMGGDVFRSELPADGFSGDVTFQLCAEDPHGNSTCSDDLVYHVVDQGGTSSGSSGGDSGTADSGSDSNDGSTTAPADSSGDETATNGGTLTTTSPSTTDATATEGGSDESSSAGGSEDGGGGCSCDVDGRGGLPWLGLFALLGVRRRRR